MDPNALVDVMLRQVQNQALILLDSRGTVVGWTMGSARIFGRSAEEMLGRTLHCLFTPEDQAAQVPENELITARETGTSEDDRWMARADGGRFWANGFVQALRADGGDLMGFAKLLRDRTDVRGQIETLHNRVDLLADEDRRKVLLFGTLAHELRTPFGAMRNAVDLIEHAYPNDTKLAYALQILKRQTKYVSTLVDDLQDLVRARTGKTVLRYERLRLDALLADAVETIRPTIEQRGQYVSLLVPPVPIGLEGDVMRLGQAFVNLLQNASKFSERGKPIFVTCTVEGHEAVVRIEDKGRGISAELLPRVFEALTQADEPSVDAPGTDGFGLGLSLVKEYVELHGGSVQVRSEGLGLGSEFTVRVPLTRRAQAASTA